MPPGEDLQDEFRFLLRLQSGSNRHRAPGGSRESPPIHRDLVLVHKVMPSEEHWGQLSVDFLVLLREETEKKCVLQ